MATKEVATVPENPYATFGFSGKTVTVKFMKVKDSEPDPIFVGVNNYQASIKRGSEVTIPEEVFEILEGAVYKDLEDDPDRPGAKIEVEKQRYPYNVISRQG